MAESGIKGYSEAGADLWFGVVAPAGLPKAITETLNQKLVEALRSPDIRQPRSSPPSTSAVWRLSRTPSSTVGPKCGHESGYGS